jgi:hypothetical protein
MPRPLTNLMAVLPYTPRADSDSRGYDQWLKEVDTPFFYSIPGVVHYSNWKISGVLRGQVDFTHISYMYLDPERCAEVWQNPELIEFAADWTRLWGRDPDNADLSINYHLYLMRCLGKIVDFSPVGMAIAFDPATDGAINGSRWQVFDQMVGASPATNFEIAFGSPAPELGRVEAGAVAIGDLIAAP